MKLLAIFVICTITCDALKCSKRAQLIKSNIVVYSKEEVEETCSTDGVFKCQLSKGSFVSPKNEQCKLFFKLFFFNL